MRDTVPAVPLDTLTVTGLRTPFSAARAPYAVTVVGTEQIQRARPGLALDEALRGVPGVQVDNRYNYALGERISIRGFGARAQFGVRGIKVLLDGIPATLPDGQTTLNQVDLGALSRVEVLRGPASALYGNAAGGVILLESEIPRGAEARVVGGANGLRRVQGTVGGVRGGVNVSHLQYGGFREWSDADNLRANARVQIGGLRVVANAVRYDARNPGSLADTALARDRTQAFANNVRQQTGEQGSQGQAGVVWQGRAGPGHVEVAGYALAREIENPIPQRIIDLERTAGGMRAMYRLDAGPFRWLVGAESELQADERLNFVNRQGERADRVLDQRERVTSAAGFTQLVATLGRRLDLLGAVRYDRFRFAVRDQLISESNPDDSGSRTLAAVSPSVGASWAIADALHLYGNVATAFETPTTTELANQPTGAGGFNPELEPQRTRSFEVGAKGWLGRIAAYQLAAYHARVRDALIPFRVPGQPDRDFFRNAGSVVHQGWEAGVALTPLPRVRSQLAYTHTSARYREYTVGGNEYRGNRIPGVAPHRLDALLSLGFWRGGYLELDGRYASDTAVNDTNTATSPAYFVSDARIGASNLRLGRVVVAPFLGVSNLFDTRYNTSVVVNAFGGRFYEPGPGRALYAGARVRPG
ncbi:MAG: TonB-dependent receptor, partial [Gemmatimonadota bacterium]|nr:TonB-dependent receptor [Gemmatimonadota bacterium]